MISRSSNRNGSRPLIHPAHRSTIPVQYHSIAGSII